MFKRTKQFISPQQRKVIEKARAVALGDDKTEPPEEALLDLLDVVDSLDKKAQGVLNIANELELEV